MVYYLPNFNIQLVVSVGDHSEEYCERGGGVGYDSYVNPDQPTTPTTGDPLIGDHTWVPDLDASSLCDSQYSHIDASSIHTDRIE